MRARLLIPSLLLLGSAACTKDTPSVPRFKADSAQSVSAQRGAPPTAQNGAARRSARPDGGQATSAVGRLELRSPLVASADAFPVVLFAPLSELDAAELARPFEHRFRVRTAVDQPVQELSSCDSLLALALREPNPQLDPGKELEIQGFWSMAVECLALRLANDARPAQRSRIADALTVKDPSRLLPPLLGMADFYDERKRVEAAAARCESWKAYDKSVRLTKKGPERFTIRADVWSGELVWYGRGDFDADGYEDLLVRRNGGAEGGSFGASALFLLSQTDQDDCIRVVRELGRS